jgi:hypothetical protein
MHVWSGPKRPKITSGKLRLIKMRLKIDADALELNDGIGFTALQLSRVQLVVSIRNANVDFCQHTHLADHTF